MSTDLTTLRGRLRGQLAEVSSGRLKGEIPILDSNAMVLLPADIKLLLDALDEGDVARAALEQSVRDMAHMLMRVKQQTNENEKQEK